VTSVTLVTARTRPGGNDWLWRWAMTETPGCQRRRRRRGGGEYEVHSAHPAQQHSTPRANHEPTTRMPAIACCFSPLRVCASRERVCQVAAHRLPLVDVSEPPSQSTMSGCLSVCLPVPSLVRESHSRPRRRRRRLQRRTTTRADKAGKTQQGARRVPPTASTQRWHRRPPTCLPATATETTKDCLLTLCAPYGLWSASRPLCAELLCVLCVCAEGPPLRSPASKWPLPAGPSSPSLSRSRSLTIFSLAHSPPTSVRPSTSSHHESTCTCTLSVPVPVTTLFATYDSARCGMAAPLPEGRRGPGSPQRTPTPTRRARRQNRVRACVRAWARPTFREEAVMEVEEAGRQAGSGLRVQSAAEELAGCRRDPGPGGGMQMRWLVGGKPAAAAAPSEPLCRG
jgi:hypothetical protein